MEIVGSAITSDPKISGAFSLAPSYDVEVEKSGQLLSDICLGES